MGWRRVEQFRGEPPGGGTTPATLYVMNNGVNLFIAIRFERAALDLANAVFFDFDNKHIGAFSTGDDGFVFCDTCFSPSPNFIDRVRLPNPTPDTTVGGTTDGAGASGNAGGFTVLEFRKPLNSGDTNDFSLVPGNTVGFSFFLQIANASVTGGTTVPGTGLGDIVIAPNHPSVTGSGTATIDGVFNASEWANAGTLTFAANLPEGGTTQATLYAMNNRSNLFLAVRFARPSLDFANSVFFTFDNNHDGGFQPGEDEIFFDHTSPTPFRDRFQPTGDDTSAGGSNDGAGARGNAAGFSVLEVSHPLNSGDTHDFSLEPGNTVGFFLILNIHNGTALGTTTFPTIGAGDIVISSNHPPTVQNLAVSGPANMPTPIHLAGSDVDGNSLTFSFASPAHGTLSGTPPDLIYTPSLNFIGTDSFLYKASDGPSESALATVVITIKNGVAINDAFVTEGNRGNTNAIFTVRFTAPIIEKVEVNFVTSDRTATQGLTT
jgi:hypothetical protein